MESGINKKPNILILTSFLSNDNSSKMILDVSKSLESYYNIDVLTKYPFETDKLNVYSAYNKYEKLRHNYFDYSKSIFKKYKKFFSKEIVKESLPYYFFGLNEEKPPVDTKKLLTKIKKDYDFIIVFFWQGLVTSRTLKDIHDKFKIPFLLVAADMFPMTGGCSYFWDCDRLEKSCGKCPGISSNDENDASKKSFLYKKDVFDTINSIFLGNSWQINHAIKSEMFKKMEKIYPIVDENIFKPRDKTILKEKFNCSGKIVLFFGSLGVHDPRKGFRYLLESLKFLKKHRPDLVANIVLMIAGSGDKVVGLEDYIVEYSGHLTFDQLAEYYAMADVFLSPSIQDAGPMMLNQALMCGTPAVAFSIGTACDIINDGTGYLAKYKDSEDFCNGIIKLITKTPLELKYMSENCRSESLPRSSYKGFSEAILYAYNMINSR